MGFVVIIPARYASTRLPAKPLADIHGKPMVVRVAERAVLSGADSVWIVADDERITAAAHAHGHTTLLTGTHHTSGTGRLAEAVDALALNDDCIVVNVQGDEPLIDPQLIRTVAQELADHPESAVATLCHPIQDEDSFLNPNHVKVVMNQAGHALYFSRAPIPWPRDGWRHSSLQSDAPPIYRHIGLYAYRASFLRQYNQLSPSPLEHIESLEQLRVLWHGYSISVAISQLPAAPGVDTPSDLELARTQFASTLLSTLSP
jgi:3-deoxy-manno-octulosonate cytidylyltransferase (CMP-KDO synthetase)